MDTKIFKILILIVCLMFCQSIFAVEEEVIVVTNVPYEASLTKKASTENATMDPANGTHTGLSTVFTLQTNGGDEHFDYIITSSVNKLGETVSGFGPDGRLLFTHATELQSDTPINNAKTGSGKSPCVIAYPVSVTATNGRTVSFETSYGVYGDCYVVLDNGAEIGDVTFSVLGTPCSNTYEAGLDQEGNYKAVMMFTITSK